MPMYDYQLLVQSDTANTAAAVGTNSINTGVVYPDLQASGQFGLHVVVTLAFTSLTEGVRLIIVHSAADDIGTGSEEHTSMFAPASEMVLGAHFFVPAGSRRLKQYVGFLWKPVSTSGATGKTTVYFGDREWLGPK